MRDMSVELCFPIGTIAIGVAFSLSAQQVCQHLCLLDKAADFVLPETLV